MQFNKKWAILSELVSMASCQGGASIAKYLFRQVGPAGAVTLRVGLAGLLLSLIHRPKFWFFTKKQWFYILFYGMSVGSMNLSFYYGIQRVPLGVAVTIEFVGPLGLALILSRKATDFLWAVLAAVGILLIVPWHRGEVDLIGVGFVALAGLMWALYIFATSRINGVVKHSDAVSCGMSVAALLVLPFGLLSGDLLHLNWTLFAIGLAVAICSSALPFTLDLLAMRKIPAKTFSVLQSLQPAFGALSGLLFLQEYLSLKQWIAMCCIITASTGAALCAPEKKDGK